MIVPGGRVAKQGIYDMRWLSLAVLGIVLSGCALPPVITLASLVADVASYAATGKTVTDHGISLVLQKDCALLRGLEGPVCLEPDPARRARELEARNIRYEYASESDHPVLVRPLLARAVADPAVEFGASLAFVSDPAVAPRGSGQGSGKWLEEVSYLSDSLGREG